MKRIQEDLKTLNDIIKSCNTCRNSSCRIENDEKRGLDKNGNPMGYDCIGYINHNLILKKTKRL